MSDRSLASFIEQPAKTELSVYDLTQIAAALSLQISKTSFNVFVFGGSFVFFNTITFGIFKKPLGPIAVFLMKSVAKRSAALTLLDKIERTLLIGLDGRTTTFARAMKEVVEAAKSK